MRASFVHGIKQKEKKFPNHVIFFCERQFGKREIAPALASDKAGLQFPAGRIWAGALALWPCLLLWSHGWLYPPGTRLCRSAGML